MRKTWIFLSLLIATWSCGNDIDLYPDEADSRYMIYGILDSNDSVQQIKIRKTFAGEDSQNNLADQTALFLPDPSIRVWVEKIGGTSDDVVEFLPNEYPKVSGFFGNDHNPIHEAVFTPEPKSSYRLVVLDPALDDTITASMTTIRTPLITYPFNGNAQYNFADTANPFVFRFSATGEVHLQQVYVNYIELESDGDTAFCHKRFDLRPRYKDSTYIVNYYTKAMELGYLFNIIRNQVSERDEVRLRMLHSFDFIVWAGDQVMSNYLQFAEAFSDNRKLYFSNLENAFGFFAASSHAEVHNLYPTQPFYDTLVLNKITKVLKFSDKRYVGEFKREGK